MLHRALNLSCLAILSVLFSISLIAAPSIDIVAPNTLFFGKGGEVAVTLHGATPDTQLMVVPGGPSIQATLPLPAMAHDIIANENIAVIAAGTTGLIIVDLANFQVSGTYRNGSDYRLLTFHSNQVLAADNEGHLIQLDIHDPHQPRVLNTLDVGSSITAMIWTGENAYLLHGNNTLQTIEVSTSAKMRVISEQHLDFPTLSIASDGRNVYAAGGDQGLFVLNPANGKVIGHYRTTGPALDVAVQQGMAFVAQGEKGLLVLDVDNAAAPIWLGSHSKLGDVRRIVVQNDRALLFNRQGLVTMIDISRAEMPTIWASYPIRSAVQVIAIQGRNALVVAGQSVQQLNFSAQAPQISNEGLDVGRDVNFGGERRAFIEGNIIYVADWFSGIHLYDIRNPESPKLLSSFHTPGSAKGIVVRDGVAYVADDDHGLQIIDVHNPLRPKTISNLPTPGLAYSPKLVNNTLYLAGHRGGFQIIDVQDVTKPRLITTVETPGMAWGIAIDGTTAYVADDQAGLLIIDVSDANKARLVGEFNPSGRAEDVIVHDGIAYVSFFDQGLYIVDVHDTSAPKELSHLVTPGNARGIALQHDYLYLADWLAGVEVIDVQDLAHPHLVGSYDTPGAAWGVNVQADNVYVSDWWGGFMVLNVKDPQRPLFAGRYHERGRIEQVDIKDNFLFTANGSGGMQVFDTKNPLNPTWITGVDTDYSADLILINNDLAFLDKSNGSVSLIDIKNPYESNVVGNLNLPAPAVAIASNGNYAYFAIPKIGIIIADVSIPRLPKEIARYIAQVSDMWLKGDKLYLLTPSGLLLCLDVSEPSHPILRSQDLLSDNSSLIRALGDTLIVFQPQRGLMALRDQGNGMQIYASYPFSGIITDMTVADNKLFATVANDGVYIFTLDDHDFHVRGHYPLISNVTRVSAHQGTLYFSGESTITALSPLPDFNLEQKGADQITMKLPPHAPLGSYNLVLIDHDGNTVIDINALQMAMPRFTRPKITPEEFEHLLQQERAKNHVQSPPDR